MTASFGRLSAGIFLLASSCAPEAPCAPPAPHWTASAPADADTIVIDRHDRIFWNGEIMSQERLRNPLNQAEAEARTVKLVAAPGARCRMIETVRLAMERALSCRKGRCAETAQVQ